MGLLRGMARTAVVAGTATAVSNRVSRRQAGRWAAQDQQAAGPAYPYEQQPPYQPPAPAPVQQAGTGEGDALAQLQKLGELKAAGVLTEEEFAAEKARILAR